MRSHTRFIQVPLLAGLLLLAFTLPPVSRAEVAQEGGFVLQGNVLRVGVSDSGGLINDEPCDTDFDDPDCVGIDYDRTGTATWTAWDFLKPGSPFEFFSVGYAPASGVEPSWEAAGYSSGNTFNAVSTDTSTGSVLSAQTVGYYNSVRIEHNFYFQQNSGIINFTTTLTNESSEQLTDVVFARGLDPDQDSYYDTGSTDPDCDGNTSQTENDIHLPDLVTARGVCTDWTIGLRDLTGGGVPTVSPYWEQNPYLLFEPGSSNGGVFGEDGFSNYRDDTINLAWRKATLDPGETWTLRYQYIIDETFVGVTQLNINTQTLPSAPVNETYTTYIEAVGGELPYTWSIIDKTPSAIVAAHPNVETMLNNLSIDPETGKLTWIDLPALIDAPGIYIDFTVQVMDDNGDTATATFRYTDPPGDAAALSGQSGGGGGLGWPLLAAGMIVLLRRRY